MPAPFQSRRRLLRTALGGLGLTLADVLRLQRCAGASPAAAPGFGRAKACIVLFSWGGMSQLEGWDPKPDAPKEVRGDYQAIASATSGIQLGEGLPELAKRTGMLAIVRAMSHKARDHRQAAYLNLTGRPPIGLNGMMVADPVAPTRDDPPSFGAMLSRVAPCAKDLPGSVVLPYPIAERGPVAGQNAGFLGPSFDPVVVRPVSGALYEGVSPLSAMPRMTLDDGMNPERMHAREQLLRGLAGKLNGLADHASVDEYMRFQQAAMDVLTSSRFSTALDVSKEPAELRASYGDHICGQSVLTARRLTEAGVPLVTVVCSAGDLNGSFGAHWDHHFQIFPRVKQQLMPPLDRASAALLDDLASRGTLDQTLVVWMTEFGRSPTINSLAGRDHWPDCYSIALAGAGIKGGVVHGKSDRLGALPDGGAWSPQDLHVTIFHALGIDPLQSFPDPSGASHRLSIGRPLPIFG